MSGQTDWMSAIAILASGLILGGMFIYFVRRKSARVQIDGELRDLEAKRDVLVQQIRAEGDAEERARLEVEAAQVLRRLDAYAGPASAGPDGPKPVPGNVPRNPALIGFAWGAGSVVILGLLGYFVMKSATERQNEPGQNAMQPAQQAAAPDPALMALEASVKRQPDNLDVRIDLARAYLERENLMGVFEQTQFVLTKSPDDSRALTYQALVRMAMGDNASAEAMLKKALQSDPNFLDAYVTMAWVQTQSGAVADAEKTMREAMRRHPEERVRLQQVLDAMKQHQSVPAAPQTPAPAGPVVRITIDGPSNARGTLFLIVRGAGVTSGPPIAAKRVDASSFPLTLELSAADSMMGQPLPPTMRVEARLDADGVAATRSPSDPSAFQDGVSAGSTIKLSLK